MNSEIGQVKYIKKENILSATSTTPDSNLICCNLPAKLSVISVRNYVDLTTLL